MVSELPWFRQRKWRLIVFLSRQSKALRFRLRGDLTAMVIDMPTCPDLRGNWYSSHKSRPSGVDGNGEL